LDAFAQSKNGNVKMAKKGTKVDCLVKKLQDGGTDSLRVSFPAGDYYVTPNGDQINKFIRRRGVNGVYDEGYNVTDGDTTAFRMQDNIIEEINNPKERKLLVDYINSLNGNVPNANLPRYKYLKYTNGNGEITEVIEDTFDPKDDSFQGRRKVVKITSPNGTRPEYRSASDDFYGFTDSDTQDSLKNVFNELLKRTNTHSANSPI